MREVMTVGGGECRCASPYGGGLEGLALQSCLMFSLMGLPASVLEGSCTKRSFWRLDARSARLSPGDKMGNFLVQICACSFWELRAWDCVVQMRCGEQVQ